MADRILSMKANSITPKGRQVSRIVNSPLGFDFRGLDADHPYLRDRGFEPKTIERFGLAFCSRGLFKDRIIIPLHDAGGRLIGYAGRVVDDKAISDENPRYLFPDERTRNNVILEFRKTLFVYNGFRIKVPAEELIVVEGFTSVWWLTQEGLPNVIATMGADCSEKQAELIGGIVSANGLVWIISDGDQAGHRHAEAVLKLVSPHRFVRWVKLPEGKQPTDFRGKDLMSK